MVLGDDSHKIPARQLANASTEGRKGQDDSKSAHSRRLPVRTSLVKMTKEKFRDRTETWHELTVGGDRYIRGTWRMMVHLPPTTIFHRALAVLD